MTTEIPDWQKPREEQKYSLEDNALIARILILDAIEIFSEVPEDRKFKQIRKVIHEGTSKKGDVPIEVETALPVNGKDCNISFLAVIDENNPRRLKEMKLTIFKSCDGIPDTQQTATISYSHSKDKGGVEYGSIKVSGVLLQEEKRTGTIKPTDSIDSPLAAMKIREEFNIPIFAHYRK